LNLPSAAYTKSRKRGLDIVKKKPDRIDVAYLGQFQEFKDFRALRHTKQEEEGPELDLNSKTPEESLESAHQKLRGDLATDLLQRLKTCSSTFFERLVVEVIVKMGYGAPVRTQVRQSASRETAESTASSKKTNST